MKQGDIIVSATVLWVEIGCMLYTICTVLCTRVYVPEMDTVSSHPLIRL